MTKTPPPAFSTSLLYTLYSPRNSHLVFTCFNGQNCCKQNSPPTIATVRCKPDYSLFFWTCFLISMNFPHTALLPTILPGNLSSTHLPNHLITISKSFLRHHLNHLPNISPRTQNQPAPTCSFPNCVMITVHLSVTFSPKNTSSSVAVFNALNHISVDVIM